MPMDRPEIWRAQRRMRATLAAAIDSKRQEIGVLEELLRSIDNLIERLDCLREA